MLQAATGAAALTMAARHRPDAAIVDLGLPDMDGLDVIAGSELSAPCRSWCYPAEDKPRSK